ncbi:MAG TPA: hypothetical protein VFZ34_06990 [Blastocatellia bacterium]|nr:hypothetical protein [Blastocatellia bacterium]
MLKRNIIHSITATVVMLVLSSLLVWGQGQSPPKGKATTPRKTTRRTTTQRQPPASVSPAPVAPAPPVATPAPAVETAPAPALTAPAVVSLRKPGVLRIGIVAPLTPAKQMGSGADYSEMIRQAMAANLNSPMAEAVLLDARVPVVAELEAKQKECDYILYSTVTQRARTSDLAKFMAVAAPVVNVAAGTRVVTNQPKAATPPPTTETNANATTNANANAPAPAAPPAGQSAPPNHETILKAVTDLSNRATAGDEVVFEFKLVEPGGAKPKLSKALKAKVRKDGDDMLSGLLVEAANELLQLIVKK